MVFLYFLTIFLFLLLCLLLCSVILMQDSKGAGLGVTFGGEASSSVFGTSTADVLRKFTGWLAFVFFLSCIILSYWTSAMGKNQVDGPGFSSEIEAVAALEE